MRAIAPPGDGPLMRGAELAQGLPKLAKLFKVQIAALCEVAQMLIDRLGLPSTWGQLFRYASERWDGKGQPGDSQRDEIPLPVRIVHVARDAAFQHMLGGEEFAAGVLRERAGHAFDPAIATATGGRRSGALCARDRCVDVGAHTGLRANPVADPGRRSDRSSASRNGRLRRSRVSIPRRPLRRSGRPGDGGGQVFGPRCRDPDGGSSGSACPRCGARCGAYRHLAEARTADGGRVGEGEAARVLHRARPRPFSVLDCARTDRHVPPRASRWLGLPPRNRRRIAHTACPVARRRGRVSRNDGATASPPRVRTRASRQESERGGSSGEARRRRCGRGSRGGRTACPANRAAGRTDRARGGGHRSARAWVADETDRSGARRSPPRRPTAISSTPIGRSACRHVQPLRSSRWSTGSPHWENSQ